MKPMFRKTIACLLAVCCLLPILAAAEGSELNQRMGKALAAGRQIETIIRLEVNEELLASGTPPELVTALQELLRDTEIRVRWAQDDTGWGMGRFAVATRGTEILSGAAEAWEEGIALATSVLPGKTLLIPYAAIAEALQGAVQWDQSALPLDALVASGEAYFGAVMGWLGQQQVALALDDTPVAATQNRDASVNAIHLTLSAEQVKALFTVLVGVMAQDSAMASLLQVDQAEIDKAAGELSAFVEALVPMQAALQFDMYWSDAGDIVGVDCTIPKMFESLAGEGEFHYDAKTAEGMSGNAFEGSATWGDEGKLRLSVGRSSREIALLGTVTDDFTLRGMLKYSPAEDAIGVTVSSKVSRTPSPTGEKSTGSFGIIVEPAERPETGAPTANSEDAAQWVQGMLPATWFDFRLGFESQTQFIGENDFRTGTVVTQSQIGALRMESFSSELQTAIDPGNTVVDLSQLDETEQQALLSELEAGLAQAAQVAVPLIPPALVEAFVAE